MLVDATTAVEDGSLLGQRGLRPGGHRGRRHRRAPRPSARRVDHHPAARAAAPAHGQRRRGDRALREPEGQGDHPVDPRHPGVLRASRASRGSWPPTSTRTTTATSRTASPPPRRATSASRSKDLTLAQAAIIAALPKSPSTYDLVRNAERGMPGSGRRDRHVRQCKKSQLVVPDDATIVQRRNQVLDHMEQAAGRRSPATRSRAADFDGGAQAEKVVLAPQQSAPWRASHSSCGRSASELTDRLCGADAETCPDLERGGLDITTTLDVRLQRLAEKWVKAAPIVPHAKEPRGGGQGAGAQVRAWMRNLRNKDLRNGALIADGLPDRRDRRLRRVGEPERDARDQEVPAPLRRPGGRLAPARLRVQADRLRTGIAQQEHHRGIDVHGRRHRLRRRLHADRRRQPRARPGPRARRPPCSRSTSRPSRRSRSSATTRSSSRPRRWASSSGRQDRRRAVVRRSASRRSTRRTWCARTASSPTAASSPTRRRCSPSPTATARRSSSPTTRAQRRAGHRPGRCRHHHRHPVRQHRPQAEPVLGPVRADQDGGKRRPATLKTGTNNDARDLNAYGYIGAPTTRASARTASTRSRSAPGTATRTTRSSARPTSRCSRSTSRRTSGRASSRRRPRAGTSTASRAGGAPDREDRPVDGAWRPVPRPARSTSCSSSGPARRECCPPDAALRRGRSSAAPGFENEHAAWLEADRGLAGARGTPWRRRPRRAGGHPHRVLLQRACSSLRQVVGRPGQRQTAAAQPSPSPSASFDPCALPIESVDPSALPSLLVELCPSPSEPPSAHRGAAARPRRRPRRRRPRSRQRSRRHRPPAEPTPEPTPEPTVEPAAS